MRSIIVIVGLNIIFFLGEFFLRNLLGRWFHPNLLLLLSVFITLYLGIRWGIFSAVIGGLLNDSFAATVFGQHIFVMVVCVYSVTILRQSFYHLGAKSSRMFLILLVTSLNLGIHWVIYNIFAPLSGGSFVREIFLPELIATLIATLFVFRYLKQCASSLFAS